MVDVRNKTTTLITIASHCGMNTEGWGVFRGTKSYNLAYRKPGFKDLVNIKIGDSAREACQQLNTMILGMTLMYEQMTPGRLVRTLKAALLAVDRMEVHLRKCSHCTAHMLDKRTGWCEAYLTLLRARDEGMRLATCEHRNPHPLNRTIPA